MPNTISILWRNVNVAEEEFEDTKGVISKATNATYLEIRQGNRKP
jgi:hypothetical protein